jgi:hypothetical protein
MRASVSLILLGRWYSLRLRGLGADLSDMRGGSESSRNLHVRGSGINRGHMTSPLSQQFHFLISDFLPVHIQPDSDKQDRDGVAEARNSGLGAPE